MPRKKAPDGRQLFWWSTYPTCLPQSTFLRRCAFSTLPPGLRQRLLTHDQVLRNLEISQALAREGKKIARIRLGARPHHDYRAYFFAHHLVGHADHRDLEHGGVRGQGAL